MFYAAMGASCKNEPNACVFAIDIAASKRLSCDECFALEVGFSFVRLPSSGWREVECEVGYLHRIILCGCHWVAGVCTLNGVLSGGPIQC